MTKTESKIMRVYNPYSDEYEDLVCEFQLHLNSKRKLDGVNISSIISNGGSELMDFLDPDKIPNSIEQDFLREWEG